MNLPQSYSYSDSEWITCFDCPKVWRYGCAPCAEHFAEYHRTAFEGHHVELGLPARRRIAQTVRRRDRWWETHQ